MFSAIYHLLASMWYLNEQNNPAVTFSGKMWTSYIRMSHWRQQMVDGAEHLISCHWLAFLSAFSHLQLIQNSAPSTICWCQCDIRIWKKKKSYFEIYLVEGSFKQNIAHQHFAKFLPQKLKKWHFHSILFHLKSKQKSEFCVFVLSWTKFGWA